MNKPSTTFLDNPRTAKIALWGGILFSILFTALIWWAGERLDAVPLLPDQAWPGITGSCPNRPSGRA